MSHDVPKKIDAEKAMRAASEDADDKAMDKLAKTLAGVSKRDVSPIWAFPEAESDSGIGTASWNRQLIDPGIVELALSLGLSVRVPKGDPRTFTFFLYHWARRGPRELDELRLVSAHPFFGPVLVNSFFPRRETKSEVGNWLAKAARTPEAFARVFEALDAFGEKLDETWTVGALATHEEWIENLCQPAVLERCPALARAVREMEPARLLRNQLRAGIMDEWGWPAYEKALALFPKERQHDIATEADSGGPPPYVVMRDKKTGRVVVVGPDSIVLDRTFPAVKKMNDVRQILFAGGDVLACEYPNKARWLVANAPLEMEAYEPRNVAYEAGVITKARKVLRPSDKKPPPIAKDYAHTQRIWLDGTKHYALPQEVELGADGSARDEYAHQGSEVFDPETGKTTGHAIPSWMAKLVGDGVLVAHIDSSFMLAVPKGAEQSPLGAKDGFGGSALVRRDGEVFVQGIDGRRASGLVNGLYTVALMTFPAREGFYPIVQSAFDLGIAMPDGTTPLVPMDAIKYDYWAGTPYLPLLAWHALRPRDLAASKALARCSDEAAKAIYAKASADDEEIPKALLDAVKRALPEVKDARMIAGVAGVAQAAARNAAIVTRLKSRVTTTTKTAASAKSSLLNEHAAALSRLFEHERHWWIEKLGVQLGQQILDVSQFLFEPAPGDRVVTPAPTVVPWPLLLERIGEVLYRVRAPGTPKARRAELVKVLELWLETGFPSNLSRVRLVELALPSNAEELAGFDREHPQRLIAWENRYFLTFRGMDKKLVKVAGIEVAADGKFRVPAGGKLERAQPADARFGVEAIQKTLALLEGRGTAKFDRMIPELVAKKSKLSKTAATLLWCAGYDPWLIAEKKQARFEVERDAIDDAERELKKLPLASIYARAMPDDPAQLDDGAIMAERLVAALRAK